MVIVGIDEVGRGCWAGPLVAGAVIIDEPIEGLKDSKLLSRSKRDKLNIDIKLMAKAYGLGWVQPDELDKVGLTEAVRLAMQRALSEIDIVDYDEIIIDGNLNFLASNPKSRALIKADNLVPAVSAASILAKVARDDYMGSIAKDYADYGFEQHVGYGTKLHIERLKLYGVSDLHRRSFKPIQALVGNSL